MTRTPQDSISVAVPAESLFGGLFRSNGRWRQRSNCGTGLLLRGSLHLWRGCSCCFLTLPSGCPSALSGRGCRVWICRRSWSGARENHRAGLLLVAVREEALVAELAVAVVAVEIARLVVDERALLVGELAFPK